MDDYIPILRDVTAVALVVAFPFVLFFAHTDDTMLKAYTDAVTAVVGFFFAVRATETE